MTENPPEPDAPETDPLITEIRRAAARRERWLREGDMSVGRRLAQIGVLGWIFVAPTLAGLFLGRWLDARLGSGLFWSAPLMLLGVCLWGLDGLEMDERKMTDVFALPPLGLLVLCFLGGIVLGLGYFLALRETARLIVTGGPPLRAVVLTLGRVFVLVAGFCVAVMLGGPALLAALAGVLAAKWALVRKTQGTAP